MRNLALEARLTPAVGVPSTIAGIYLTATGVYRLVTEGLAGLPWLLGGIAAGALAVAAAFHTRRLRRDARWLNAALRISPLVEDPAVMAVARRGGRLLGAVAGLWGLVAAAGWVTAVRGGAMLSPGDFAFTAVILAIPLAFGLLTIRHARLLYTGVPQGGLAAVHAFALLDWIALVGALQGLLDGAWTRSALLLGALAGLVVCGTLVSRASQVLTGERPAPERR